jgi:hypothetical protein
MSAIAKLGSDCFGWFKNTSGDVIKKAKEHPYLAGAALAGLAVATIPGAVSCFQSALCEPQTILGSETLGNYLYGAASACPDPSDLCKLAIENGKMTLASLGAAVCGTAAAAWKWCKGEPRREAPPILQRALEEKKEERGADGRADEFRRHQRAVSIQEQIDYVDESGLVTQDERELLEKALTPFCCGKKNPAVEALLLNAMAIRAIYKETHITCAHGMSSAWIIYPYLLKEVLRVQEPGRNLKRFKCLRIPKAAKETIGKLRLKSLQGINDENEKIREELLCGLANFCDTTIGESPIFFLKCNASIKNSPSSRLDACKQILQKYYPHVSEDRLMKCCIEIERLFHIKAPCGSLVVIAAPKGRPLNESLNLSHPYGVLCTCNRSMPVEQVLEQLQEENAKPHLCASGRNPQVRIFIPRLSPDDGFRVYLFTPFDKATRKEIKAELKKIAQDLKTENDSALPERKW